MEVPVLLPKIFNHPFTYKNETIKNLNQGDFVLVQFGKKKRNRHCLGQNRVNKQKYKIKKDREKIT